MKKYYIISVLVFAAMCSVGFLYINKTPEHILSRDEYIKWVENENNGLREIQKEEGLVYEVIYCPLDYIIAREFRTDVIDKKAFKNRLNELKGLNYFKLRMRRKNSNEEVLSYHLDGGQKEYYERVDFLSYGFDENLFLLQNNLADTLHPALFHFERTYGVVPYIDFLIAFKEDSLSNDAHKVFVMDDKVFGTGVLRFDFNSDKIKNSPKLFVK